MSPGGTRNVSRFPLAEIGVKRILQGQDQKRVVIVHLEGAEVSDSDILYLKDPQTRRPLPESDADHEWGTHDNEEMAELQDLDLSDTKITALRLTGLSKLQELKLSGTPVESMRMVGLGDLQVLDLSGTKLR